MEATIGLEQLQRHLDRRKEYEVELQHLKVELETLQEERRVVRLLMELYYVKINCCCNG